MNRRILLAHDHAMLREGLRALLERDATGEVVGEAHDGRTAVRLARQLRPDLVLIDVALPQLNGVEATREIKRERPDTRVIGLSAHDRERLVTRMLQAGASGYVLTSAPFEELQRAIQAVTEGRIFTSEAITDRLLRKMVQGQGNTDGDDLSPLTPREREVLQQIAEGRGTRESAAALGVSVSTIETHRARVMEKLGLRTVAGLVKYAIREGLTDVR